MVHEATITVYVEGCRWTEVYTGTEEEIHAEAFDFMQSLCARYISDNRVPKEEQDAIIDGAYYELSWIEEPYIELFVVFDKSNERPIKGIYASRADAEEAFFDICDEWVYETMMLDDPMDVWGKENWDYCSDYWYLMQDAADTLEIITSYGYDVKESES